MSRSGEGRPKASFLRVLPVLAVLRVMADSPPAHAAFRFNNIIIDPTLAAQLTFATGNSSGFGVINNGRRGRAFFGIDTSILGNLNRNNFLGNGIYNRFFNPYGRFGRNNFYDPFRFRNFFNPRGEQGFRGISPSAIQEQPQAQSVPAANTSAQVDHGGSNVSDTGSERPEAPVSNTGTGAQPVSAQQRKDSEQFPNGRNNPALDELPKLVKKAGFPSANGKEDQQLCERAFSHSADLALQRPRFVHHGGLNNFRNSTGRKKTTEVAAISVRSLNTEDAAADCLSQWTQTQDNEALLKQEYNNYCFAVVRVGNVFGCTGVFD